MSITRVGGCEKNGCHSQSEAMDDAGHSCAVSRVAGFHCFTTVGEAEEGVDAGYCSGSPGSSRSRIRGVAEVVKLTPWDRLVVETDAPYLAPSPAKAKGERNRRW